MNQRCTVLCQQRLAHGAECEVRHRQKVVQLPRWRLQIQDVVSPQGECKQRQASAVLRGAPVLESTIQNYIFTSRALWLDLVGRAVVAAADLKEPHLQKATHLELHVGPVHIVVISVLEALNGAAELLHGVLQLVGLEPVGAEPGEVALGQRHFLNRLSPGVLVPQVLVVDPGCRQ